MHRSVLALPLVLALAPPLAQTTERVAAAETTYEIAPGSEVGFEGKSTLHGFTGRTTHVSGSVRTTLSDPGALCSGRIEADAASLDTGSTGRDKDMREVLEVGAHPKIVFELDRLERAGRDAASGVITGTAAGRITIRGVTRPFTMPVRVVQAQAQIGL